jgi:hypothetical protein
MFSAFSKESRAKRKANRAAANLKFHTRIAEINQKRDIELALIELEKQANNERLAERLAQNNAQLREAWSR